MQWRLQWYPVVALAVVSAVVIISAVKAVDSKDLEFTGDFPAFYGAGRIAADGDWDQLYSPARQAQEQADLFPPEYAGWAVWRFAYPPQVAAAYRPLAALPYQWSYLIHTAVMFLALLGAVFLLRPMIGWIHGHESLVVLIALLFWPMFRAVTGGSNPALTVFVVVAVWRLIFEDRTIAAGLVLSLLWFKPQIAIPLAGLFLLARYWRVVVGFVAGSIPFFLLGIFLLGPSWIEQWVDAAVTFGRDDAEVNGHFAISFLGVLQKAFGVDSVGASAIGFALAGLTAAVLASLWYRGPREALGAKLAVAMPGILLLSPHAMSHEGAIVVLAVAICLRSAWWTPWMIGSIWVLGACQLFVRASSLNPGLFVLVIVFVWAIMAHRAELSPAAYSAGSRLEADGDAARPDSAKESRVVDARQLHG
jgi:hypothetical protein